MKYILTVTLFLFIGCSEKKKDNRPNGMIVDSAITYGAPIIHDTIYIDTCGQIKLSNIRNDSQYRIRVIQDGTGNKNSTITISK